MKIPVKVRSVEIDGNREWRVNARDLWKFLESKQEFSHWIKNRIATYRFEEGADYFSFDKLIKRETGASVRTEYSITLDMAKELAMIENTVVGRKVRKYFIEVEKRYRERFGKVRVRRFGELYHEFYLHHGVVESDLLSRDYKDEVLDELEWLAGTILENEGGERKNTPVLNEMIKHLVRLEELESERLDVFGEYLKQLKDIHSKLTDVLREENEFFDKIPFRLFD